MSVRRGIAGKCEVAGVTVGSLVRSSARIGVRPDPRALCNDGEKVRSHCCGEPYLTVGLRSLLRAGRDASPNGLV